MFDSVAAFSPAVTTTTLLRSPRVYIYIQETNTQIFEDLFDTAMFKPMIFSKNSAVLFPETSLMNIGRNLGFWLRSFHTWATAPEQASLRTKMLYDDPMRELKHKLTYGGFLGVLDNFPELLHGHRATLETIIDAITKEFKTPPTVEREDWGLIHGDFWPGK